MIVTYPIGMMQANCYLVYDKENGDSVIIDPGGDATPVLKEIEKRQLSPHYILNTHGHFDHIAGNASLASLNVPFAIHPADRDLLITGGGAQWFGLPYSRSPSPALDLTDDLVLEIGMLHIEVIHTPGHSPGSVCLYIPEDNALITGDTLFAGSVGRPDLPGGDEHVLMESLKRLLIFPPETILYPGHGPSSTLAAERHSNPWLRGITPP